LEQYLSISGLSATQYDNAGGIQKDAFAEFQNKGENIGKGDPPLPIWGSSAKGGTNELGLVNVLGNAYEWSEEGQLLGLPHTGSGGVLGRKLVRDGKDGKGEWQSFRPLLMPSAEGTKDTASAQQ